MILPRHLSLCAGAGSFALIGLSGYHHGFFADFEDAKFDYEDVEETEE